MGLITKSISFGLSPTLIKGIYVYRRKMRLIIKKGCLGRITTGPGASHSRIQQLFPAEVGGGFLGVNFFCRGGRVGPRPFLG